MLKTMGTNKKYNKILLSITSSITILASFLMIFFVLKYNLIDISSSNDIKDSKSLVSLYAKNQIHKEVEFTSKIAIKNGCGIKHLGLIYKRYLLDLGYDVTEATNAIHSNGQLNFGHSATKIFFHKKNKDSAIYLSTALGIDKTQIFEDYNNTNFHDLTLVIGKNYNKLKSFKTAKTFNPFNYD